METKHDRDSRRVKSRFRKKQWYINRLQQLEQNQVIENYFFTATQIENPTVTLLDNGYHSSNEEYFDVQLKEQSRRLIEKLRVDWAVLVKQISDIDTTISTIARTCHLDNVSELTE